jgi:hypothetical protein
MSDPELIRKVLIVGIISWLMMIWGFVIFARPWRILYLVHGIVLSTIATDFLVSLMIALSSGHVKVSYVYVYSFLPIVLGVFGLVSRVVKIRNRRTTEQGADGKTPEAPQPPH